MRVPSLARANSRTSVAELETLTPGPSGDHVPPVKRLAKTLATPEERSSQATTGPPAVMTRTASSAAPVPLTLPSDTQAPAAVS